MTLQAVAAPDAEDVQVLRPSPADWTAFVDEELAALGLTMAELREQARQRAFPSTAARELWVLIGEPEG